MKKLIFILTISMFCLTGCLSRTSSYQAAYDFSQVDKIAIFSVDGQVKSDEAKSQISNLFVIELLNKGYAPIPLAQVEAKSHTAGESNNVAVDDYVSIGQRLKVPALLLVDVPFFNNEVFITAQLINTKDGSVLWMNQSSSENEQPTSRGRYQEDYLMDPLLMIQEPTEAPKAGVPALNPGDKALTPRELQQIKFIVSKICSTLPSVSSQKGALPSSRKTTSKPKTSSNW